jgi:hypothetical protein
LCRAYGAGVLQDGGPRARGDKRFARVQFQIENFEFEMKATRIPERMKPRDFAPEFGTTEVVP